MQKSERTVLGLQQMYLDAGYAPYRMSKFEEYDLYADNKDFLISDNVITFYRYERAADGAQAGCNPLDSQESRRPSR